MALRLIKSSSQNSKREGCNFIFLHLCQFPAKGSRITRWSASLGRFFGADQKAEQKNEGQNQGRKALYQAESKEIWWKKSFQGLVPETEALHNILYCRCNRREGILFLSNNFVCFAEKAREKEGPLFVDIGNAPKQVYPFDSIVFMKTSSRGSIVLAIKDGKEIILDNFEGGQKAAIFKSLTNLYTPHQKTAQSFHTAIINKDLDKIFTLLKLPEARTDVLKANRKNETPLAAAIKHNHVKIVKALLQFYRDNKLDINMQDSCGYTALHIACLNNVKDKIIMYLLKDPQIKVNIVNSDGNTALHYLCKSFLSPSCLEIAALMLQLGVDINRPNNRGETALHQAIFNSSVRVLLIELLLDNGIKVDLQNDRGETALHYAVRLGRQDVVATLVRAGADLELKGTDNKTAYELAAECKQTETHSFLIKVHDLMEWFKRIEAEEVVKFCIKQGIFKDEIGCMTSAEFTQFLIRIEGELGPNTERYRAMKQAYQQLKNELSLKQSKEGVQVPKQDETQRKSLEQILTTTRSIAGVRKASVGYDHRRTGSSSSLSSQSDASPSDGESTEDDEDLGEESHSKQVDEGWHISPSELEFTKKIAEGASGKVYKGIYNNREVAIKVIESEEDDTESAHEFLQEIKVMKTVGHSTPEIVNFYGVCLEPAICIVMEYCSRGSLYEYLKESQEPLTWGLLIDVALQTTRGIYRLHSAQPQILHRDLKTKNILITEDWKIKIADFGLSRADTATNKSALGKICGTIAYCAPELFYGSTFSPGSDVYSMAIVLWELIIKCMTNQYVKPYGEYPQINMEIQILYQAAECGLRPTIPSACPKIMADLVKSCWAPKPSERPTTIELLKTLEQISECYKASPEEWEFTRTVN